MKPSVKADQARCEVPRNTSPGFFLRVCAMNWQTGLGLIARHVLTTIGGGLVASGVIDSGQLETGIGPSWFCLASFGACGRSGVPSDQPI
jgi:hypothetical protein